MNHYRNLANFILDFLFPRSKQVISIQNMSADELVFKIPRAMDSEDAESKALFDYRSESARQAIWEIKYRKNQKITAVFCELFYEFMLSEIADRLLFDDFQKPMLAPIPISKNRLKERGYNQCGLIVEELMRIDCGRNFALCEDALKKIKDLPSQTSVRNRTGRLRNIEGCFAANNLEKIRNANIILIDDVITTGATMSEAKKTLLNAGARQVMCFALAH